MRTQHWIRSLGLAFAAIVPATGIGSPVGAEGATLRVPEDHETITAALEAAGWGDRILVGPGTYRESLLFTDNAGDGIVLMSTHGSLETVITYGEVSNVNEAVVTFQRCSNSTQLVGFTIDGRDEARRGILCNSDSRPVLSDLQIVGVEYGIASHRGSRPYVQNVTVKSALAAGLFVSGGSIESKNSRFLLGEKYGIYMSGTTDLARIRDCLISENAQIGIQAVEADFTVTDCEIVRNGDTGIILQDSSPLMTGVRIHGHENIGIVMEASSAELIECVVDSNGFGAISSIEGEPRILRCTFRDNPKNHIGIEGDANPLIGGSIENANQFLGETELAIQSSSTASVIATHNYWDKPCIPKSLFQATLGGVKRKPWMSANLKRAFSDCATSRKYHQKWLDGKLDEEGKPIKKRDRRDQSPGGSDAATAGGAAAATSMPSVETPVTSSDAPRAPSSSEPPVPPAASGAPPSADSGTGSDDG
jgi:hypothetical protein